MGGAIESDQLAEQMIAFIRAFGLHRPEQTSRVSRWGRAKRTHW